MLRFADYIGREKYKNESHVTDELRPFRNEKDYNSDGIQKKERFINDSNE